MRNRRMTATGVFAVVALLGAGGIPATTAGIASGPAHTQTTGGDLSEFIRLYTADRSSVQRFHGLPACEERLSRTESLVNEWREKLKAIDFGTLDQHGKVDYVLMETELKSQLADVALERKQIAEMDPILPFRRIILDLELARRHMETVDPEEAARKLATIPDLVKDIRAAIEKGRKEDSKDGTKVSAVVARRASRAASSLRRTLDEWFEANEGYKPGFGWWVRKPHEEAVRAIDDYSRYLGEEIAGQRGKDDDPLVGDPIGAEALAAGLESEMIGYTPQELIGIGEREFAWCEAEMKKASAEMGLGDDWKSALERVKKDHAPPGGQDDLVKETAQNVIRYVEDRDLVTIPPLCLETWRIEMLSTQTQKTLPFAVYGGQHIGVAYATDEMSYADKEMSMRGNNRHFTRIVVPHELIPGHHLQGFMSQRNRSYRSIFGTPFYVEGWAVYWELTLWELGYPQTPEDRIGMLFWRMHRCARIIVSLKFHLGEMTPAQMVDFLVDRVGHERFGATSEVRRFIGGDYSPLYQCGYMVGALQLRALYHDLVDSGKMTPKQFNDGVLACGSVPIEMVRAELEGAELRPGWKAEWRFAEPAK